MPLAETFRALAGFPAQDLAVEVVYAALREPHGPVQRAAVRALLETRQRGHAIHLVRIYHTLHRDGQDAFTAYRPHLRTVLKETIRDASTQARANTLDLLALLGDAASATVAAAALGDPSRAVADRAVAALKEVSRIHLDELEAFRVQPHQFSAAAVDQASQGVAEALARALATYDVHHEISLVERLVALGDRGWWVTQKALEGPSEGSRRALLGVLERTPTRPAAQILFRMLREPLLQPQAARIFELRRDDAALGRAAAEVLSDLPRDEMEHLAVLTRETPWWPCVRAALPRLSPRDARRMIDFFMASKLEPADKASRLVDLAGHSSAATRLAVLGAIRLLRAPEALERLENLAADADASVPAAFLEAVVDLQPPGRSRLLSALVRSPHESVRKGAMQVLSRESLDRYLKNFDRLDEPKRQLAIQAIAKIDPSMVDRLAEDVGSLPPDRKLKVLKILEYLDKAESMKGAILDLMNDPDRKVRATAVRMAGLTGNPEALRALIHALTDSDRRIRANAVEAFEELRDPRLVRVLVPFAHDPDNRVRGNAIKALWQLGQRDVLQPLIEMLNDPEDLMRMSAAWVLGEIDIPDRLELLRGSLRREGNAEVKKRIEESLARAAPR